MFTQYKINPSNEKFLERIQQLREEIEGCESRIARNDVDIKAIVSQQVSGLETYNLFCDIYCNFFYPSATEDAGEPVGLEDMDDFIEVQRRRAVNNKINVLITDNHLLRQKQQRMIKEMERLSVFIKYDIHQKDSFQDKKHDSESDGKESDKSFKLVL